MCREGGRQSASSSGLQSVLQTSVPVSEVYQIKSSRLPISILYPSLKTTTVCRLSNTQRCLHSTPLYSIAFVRSVVVFFYCFCCPAGSASVSARLASWPVGCCQILFCSQIVGNSFFENQRTRDVGKAYGAGLLLFSVLCSAWAIRRRDRAACPCW